MSRYSRSFRQEAVFNWECNVPIKPEDMCVYDDCEAAGTLVEYAPNVWSVLCPKHLLIVQNDPVSGRPRGDRNGPRVFDMQPGWPHPDRFRRFR